MTGSGNRKMVFGSGTRLTVETSKSIIIPVMNF